MIVILLVSTLMVVSCLEPAANNNITDKIKTIIGKYISNIPDINSRYVINDELSKVINHYFKGKVNPLPLYKISLTLDRNPVKIPWTIDNVQGQEGENEVYKELSDKAGKKGKKRHYKVLKSVGSKDLPKSKKTYVNRIPVAVGKFTPHHVTPGGGTIKQHILSGSFISIAFLFYLYVLTI